MGAINADMKRVVEEQHLGYVATVCPDGTPNLSPKGTMAKIRLNPSVEVNVVDPFVRKGYRFKGVATILESGPPRQRAIAFYQARGSRVELFKEIVLVRVQTTLPIDSPAYDLGMTEDVIRDRWERHFRSIRGRGPSVPGE